MNVKKTMNVLCYLSVGTVMGGGDVGKGKDVEEEQGHRSSQFS